MELSELNHWWTEKSVRGKFVPPTHRDLFQEVKKDAGRRQTQVITGIRRTGKSTILFQLIDGLIKGGANPLHILYCSFDEPALQEKSIEDIMKEYSRLTDIDHKKESIYLFLDEVQKAKNWVSSLKLVYDNIPDVKTFVSGSASLNILADAKKSLAGRAIYYELRPLSFREFLRFKGVEVEEKRFLIYRDTLEREFGKFVLRQFPELVKEGDVSFIKAYVRNSVIEPVILKDIPKEFKEVDILLLEKLAALFLSSPGQYLSVDNIAKEVRRSKSTVYRALFYLELSLLIRTVMNYRPSVRAASRKLQRVYAYHPCLTLPFNVPMEKYAENLVLAESGAKYYWMEKEKEVDFLKDSVPIEVKYKDDIRAQDIKWLDYFIKKHGRRLGTKRAYVITKGAAGKMGGISLVPLWQFCFKGL